jgi:hypothetical protein
MDDVIELQCNEFEKRKVSLEFNAGLFDSIQPGVLDFNISLTNAVHSVNAAMKINGVEIQRYSLSNQAPHSTHEVFPQSMLKHTNHVPSRSSGFFPFAISASIAVLRSSLFLSA